MTARLVPLHRLLRRFGVDLVRHPGTTTTLGRRIGHIRAWDVDLVIDVGANAGQYARELRALEYRGQIVSIEPLPAAADHLERLARADPRWRTLRLALGKADAPAPLFVAANSYSSSLFKATGVHERAAPDARPVATIETQVRRFDGLADELIGGASRPLLKLDTQGAELDILEGAGEALDRFVGLHLEMSLVPMYAGAPLMADVVDWLETRRFLLTELEPEFSDPETGRLLQVNGLFYNAAMWPPSDGRETA
jgi:FkbM family methyltransferase